ncbi:hypothetical protein DUNSADRAFT_10768 [Dunaliella salina]|uniref:Arginine deiminase n=2 Tax=Dunaliella salina TaxID=3046 RepID=A0ABQ7GEL3_DUNSA|nr:hypothetical protein DUNSADRAFT_10768 [Dunaliella salina]|eukprot:KAF5833022.1 hypothetical protein DUNSADRAFT_10768 [Dunaliella salina]
MLGEPSTSQHLSETIAMASMRKKPSYLDVSAVHEALEEPPRKKARNVTTCKLLESKRAKQDHENELAEVAIVCEPEHSSLMMGGLHPRGSLYERPVNIDIAKAQHAEFRNLLRTHGVRVLTVREILAYNVETNIGARVDLENLALSTLKYGMAAGHQVIENMGVSQLVDTIMIQPTVHITPSYRDTGLSATYTFEPLSNLVYTRDQQITTCKGIVMGRLRSQQRQREVQVMHFCIEKLGVKVVGQIQEPGFLEGGDFFPLGQDLALLGVGLRSNPAAARQLMDQDLLGSKRFAVVRDEFDRNQDRMHLDCVFSVVSDTCCIMLEDIMGEASPLRRLVDEYVRDPETGKYSLKRQGLELASFVREEGYNIIPIKAEHQLAYACNVLNLGGSRIISVHASSARQMVRSPHFKGDVCVIDFSSITSMYGSVHCASQIIKRVPSALVPVGDDEKQNGV